jgi:hypothetical protein
MWPLPENANDPVFSHAVLRLGEFHWYLLKAARLLIARTHTKGVAEGTRFVKLEQTDFGQEVGRDEINWWVFKKEPDLPELQARAKGALDAVQTLKADVVKLKGRGYKSYEHLLTTLKELVDAHGAQVDELYDFVRWLYERDVLAPSILFAYRVWGSTRVGDRWRDVDADTPDDEVSSTPRLLAEIVLGLRRGMGLNAWDKAWMEAGEDAWYRLAGSEYEGNIEVDQDEVLSRTAWLVTDEFATYVEEVRDSLRNVLLDIETCLRERNLLESDRFWRKFVVKAASSNKTETQLWDFKETLTMWHVAGAEKDRARVTFAEEAASLANARGGTLIVGVTDARKFVGIGNAKEVESRLKFASDVIADNIDYPRNLAMFRQLLVRDESGAEKTCLLVIVAQACEVVGVRGLQGQYTYPIRRETGMTRVSPQQIDEAKTHMKSDNHDFLSEIVKFVENS